MSLRHMNEAHESVLLPGSAGPGFHFTRNMCLAPFQTPQRGTLKA
jgi:hypothetical protein